MKERVKCIINHPNCSTVNSEIFVQTLFSRIALNVIYGMLKKMRIGHDLPVSVNDRVISRGFYFHKTSLMRSFAKISKFTVNATISESNIC